MDNHINLKELWSGEGIESPQIEELFLAVANIKRKKRTTLLAMNIVMLATIGFIMYIWLHFKPTLVTTKIGIVLTIVGITIYVLAYNRLLPLLKKYNENQSNNEFLQAMIHLKEQQKFLQTTMLQVYFITLSMGLCLYLYEYVSQMPFPWSVLVYVLTLTWIGFNWFYLRPRIVRKEQNRLDKIIKNFEAIRLQH